MVATSANPAAGAPSCLDSATKKNMAPTHMTIHCGLIGNHIFRLMEPALRKSLYYPGMAQVASTEAAHRSFGALKSQRERAWDRALRGPLRSMVKDEELVWR